MSLAGTQDPPRPDAADRPLDLERALDEYDRDHSHPWNRALHLIGIPLITASIPAVFVSWPLAVGLFASGWGAQFAGHAIEGKKPSFTRDRRFMAVGAVWYLRTMRRLVVRA